MTEPQGTPQATGLREIARLAGVSHQTVSRVLNGHPNIRPATRDKVMAVVNEQNYRPSRVARALATRRHDRIGVVVDGATQIGPASTLRAIEAAAYARDYTISTLTASREGTPIRDAVSHLVDHGVDGLIAIAPRTETIRELLGDPGELPVVVINADAPQGRSTVSVDQAAGSRLAMDHLLSLGHRVIMHIAGPRDWAEGRAREAAWRESLVAAGLPVRPALVGDWTADRGYALAAQVAATPDCTAVFAANDQMALGLIHGLHEAGLRVPEDVSVVGFDDLAESAHYLPPLTTVRQDFEALGTASVTALLERIHHPGEAAKATRIPARLVLRKSTTQPRA
ncbi:LacI family DNA-binding transcriptional regulator [Galactobacter valiniphilus]|uniref:LacI family DNA-binding transcriptional regulator n=1 Tax=Galactobacter valiniphilus TaxID=2676122 RepID=UPI00373582EF